MSTSLLASSIQGAARGVQIGENIRQRRRAASAIDAADAWQRNAEGWKKEAYKWNKEYNRIYDEFEVFIEEQYNPLARNLVEWQEYSNKLKANIKGLYSMWVGAEYDRDNAYLAIQKMSEVIRELDPNNRLFDNPNKVGVDIQSMSIEKLRTAIERYLKEVKVGTQFSSQFTENDLNKEIIKRENRVNEHKEAIKSGQLNMVQF